MSKPREGKCSVCGTPIKLYDSHWFDETNGAIFCAAPDSKNPSPMGPCWQKGVRDLLSRKHIEFERFLRDLGMNYFTDG